MRKWDPLSITILPRPAEVLARADVDPDIGLLPCLEMLAPEPDKLARRPAVGRVRPPEEHEHRVLAVHGAMVLYLDLRRELELLAPVGTDVVNVVVAYSSVFRRRGQAGE